jgi:hypothetical protein
MVRGPKATGEGWKQWNVSGGRLHLQQARQRGGIKKYGDYSPGSSHEVLYEGDETEGSWHAEMPCHWAPQGIVVVLTSARSFLSRCLYSWEELRNLRALE